MVGAWATFDTHAPWLEVLGPLADPPVLLESGVAEGEGVPEPVEPPVVPVVPVDVGETAGLDEVVPVLVGVPVLAGVSVVETTVGVDDVGVGETPEPEPTTLDSIGTVVPVAAAAPPAARTPPAASASALAAMSLVIIGSSSSGLA